jgi:hypothetical protein
LVLSGSRALQMFLLVGGLAGSCRADVAFLLHEAIGVSGEETSAGHAAVHFSRLCADGPLRLRWCNSGEEGVVVSTYPKFGTDKDYEWLAVPFRVYLYGFARADQQPIYSNGVIRLMARQSQRVELFSSIVPRPGPGEYMPPGRWREVIGSAFNRDIYSFRIQTTVAEDQLALDHLNSSANLSKFDTRWNNCADFSRRLLQLYLPGQLHRDWVNDFTMTTPKAIARSFTSYAKRHPERNLQIGKYEQVSGPIRRSLDNRKFAEWAFHSKKYIIPSAIFKPVLLGIFASTYYTLGYFHPHNEHLRSQKSHNPPVLAAAPQRQELERRVDRAIERHYFQDRQEVKTFFRDLELQSVPNYDENGHLYLTVNYLGERRRLGITAANFAQSDSLIAYKFLLARLHQEATGPARNRRAPAAIAVDWQQLQELESRTHQLPLLASAGHRFREIPEQLTGGQRFKKFLIALSH